MNRGNFYGGDNRMSTKEWYQLPVNYVCSLLRSNMIDGLQEDDAKARLQEQGSNELQEAERKSPITQFLNQFKDFMVLVLVGATLISGLLGEYLDAITIVAIIIMNAILGFTQEYRAERSLRALKQLTSPMANVMRGGRLLHIWCYWKVVTEFQPISDLLVRIACMSRNQH
jgi:Ca2+-transporting ATPase